MAGERHREGMLQYKIVFYTARLFIVSVLLKRVNSGEKNSQSWFNMGGWRGATLSGQKQWQQQSFCACVPVCMCVTVCMCVMGPGGGSLHYNTQLH